MTKDIHLDDYVAGGYFITKYTGREHWIAANSDLLPPKLLSVSGIIATLAPTTYPLIDATSDSYEQYGIAPETIPDVMKWWTENNQKEIGWQQTFYELGFAQQFVKRFVTKTEDVAILGVSVHRKYSGLVLDGYDPKSSCGVEEVMARGLSPVRGDVLGFDILSYQYCSFDSWINPTYPPVIFEELHIRPNQYGFIDTLEEADRCDEFMTASDDMALHGWWLPWLIIRYPLE
jgi:hypothetical protein